MGSMGSMDSVGSAGSENAAFQKFLNVPAVRRDQGIRDFEIQGFPRAS